MRVRPPGSRALLLALLVVGCGERAPEVEVAAAPSPAAKAPPAEAPAAGSTQAHAGSTRAPAGSPTSNTGAESGGETTAIPLERLWDPYDSAGGNPDPELPTLRYYTLPG